MQNTSNYQIPAILEKMFINDQANYFPPEKGIPLSPLIDQAVSNLRFNPNSRDFNEEKFGGALFALDPKHFEEFRVEIERSALPDFRDKVASRATAIGDAELLVALQTLFVIGYRSEDLNLNNLAFQFYLEIAQQTKADTIRDPKTRKLLIAGTEGAGRIGSALGNSLLAVDFSFMGLQLRLASTGSIRTDKLYGWNAFETAILAMKLLPEASGFESKRELWSECCNLVKTTEDIYPLDLGTLGAYLVARSALVGQSKNLKPLAEGLINSLNPKKCLQIPPVPQLCANGLLKAAQIWENSECPNQAKKAVEVLVAWQMSLDKGDRDLELAKETQGIAKRLKFEII